MRVVLDSARALARGTTIATRYCAVRRQFSDGDNASSGSEMQVLDYSTVHTRLLRLIAATFALQFTGRAMQTLYQQAKQSLPGQGNSSDIGKEKALFAELHGTSCALKTFASITAAEGLEVARRACGGHGYSLFSGIGSWYTEYLPNMTFDGDNFLLTQQSARYVGTLFPLSNLLKLWTDSDTPVGECRTLSAEWPCFSRTHDRQSH